MIQVNEAAFSIALTKELIKNLANWFGSSNWDSDRFGSHRETFISWMTALTYRLMRSISVVKRRDIDRLIINILGNYDLLDRLSFLYNL